MLFRSNETSSCEPILADKDDPSWETDENIDIGDFPGMELENSSSSAEAMTHPVQQTATIPLSLSEELLDQPVLDGERVSPGGGTEPSNNYGTTVPLFLASILLMAVIIRQKKKLREDAK